MKIICDQCQAKIQIPTDKIPKNKSAKLLCPKCKNRISVSLMKKEEPEIPEIPEIEEPYNIEDSVQSPFSFMEETGKTALICEMDKDVRNKMISVLHLMDYQTDTADNTRDALKKLRYHNFEILIVNELFNTKDPNSNGVMIYHQNLSMETRRNMFIIMISSRYRTLDHLNAFSKSVNLIINPYKSENIEGTMSKAITENEMLYRIYHDISKKLLERLIM